MDRLKLADELEKGIADPDSTPDMVGEYVRMHLPTILSALRDAGTGRDSGEAAEAMREAAAKVVEAHTYKGQGTEDRNDLIGMFARGQMRCKAAVAKKIRALPLQTGSDGHE